MTPPVLSAVRVTLIMILIVLTIAECVSDLRYRQIPPVLSLTHAAGTLVACALCSSLTAGLAGAVLWAGTFFLVIAVSVIRRPATPESVGLGGADLIVAISCGAVVGAAATPGWVPVALCLSTLCAALIGLRVTQVPLVPLMWGASALALWCA